VISIPDVLLKAAEVIETRGWHQGGYVPNDPYTDLTACPVCVLGAINVASGQSLENDFYSSVMHAVNVQAAVALAKHLGLADVTDPVDLIDAVGEHWNDEVATSPEQVITALRECAAELKASA
jgi:hypothetical protein